MWLELGATNHDPKVTVKYFLDTIASVKGNTTKVCLGRPKYTKLSLKGCPSIVRCDKGTENCHIAVLQMCLHDHHDDAFSGKRAFRYGKSTTNTVRVLAFIKHLID